MLPIKFLRRISSRFSKIFKNPEAILANAIKDGLPEVVHGPCRYLVTKTFPDAEAQRVADTVEKRRKEIATTLKEPIEIIYSPKPGSADNPERPAEGARLLFSAERVANTGKNAQWGIFLYLCAREAGARKGIELGSCAGLSAYYLSLTPSMERLITIEGSAALADVARETLRPLGEKTQVVNALFNAALDDMLPNMKDIDLAYIDGHHEKVATLTYFERLKPVLAPGALVLFDDISWSQDMREGWDAICQMAGMSDCIDLGVVGVCIWNPKADKARVWDLRSMVGVSGVGKPHGWDKKAGTIVD